MIQKDFKEFKRVQKDSRTVRRFERIQDTEGFRKFEKGSEIRMVQNDT